MGEKQGVAYVCWCGKAAQWFEYPHPGTTVSLCAEHKPQFEIKVVKPADYGPVPARSS